MNIKKLFPEDKITKKGLLEFLDKKGFYIVLVLCIAIVGATAVFITTHNVSSPDTEFSTPNIASEEPGASSAVNNNQDKAVMQSSTNTAPSAGVQKPEAAKPQSSVAANTPAKQAAPQKNTGGTTQKTNPSGTKTNLPEKTQNFIMPVFGSVSFDYAQDRLVYSKTLEEWRTHSGVDLAADRGTVVKAVADGVVSEIKNDPRLGIIVIIDHQNGIKTVYANLAGDDMVSPNQKVKQGDAIGCVGNTASFESAEQQHLHFEVLKNNEPVNPLSYLPNQKQS
ncbi:MAG: M23 family metallopeptidase [Clostridiales bacterium]|nr:M23 family metallopeptidase [Eubacteriales bacterium]MDH7567019.1 M23 family metallopeptidase [Clostridiales bacterium]